MKLKISLLALLMLCVGVMNAGQTTTGETKGILPYPIHQSKMANGLNVVTVPYDSPGIASFYIIVRVGSRDEVEQGKTGFAHFFEHMMFRGTEKYSKEKYSDALKAIGASANANTWLDRTLYHMTGNALMLDKMFELESDRFMNLKYSVQDFKTEAGAVKGEYTKNSADPNSKLRELMNDAAFNAHTYKHTTMGFFKDVVDMPNQYDYSLEFFKRFYRPENTTILVVGDIQPDAVNALADKYFGNWKPGTFKSVITDEPKQTEPRYAHLKNASYPCTLSLNFKAPAFSDQSKEAMALDLLSTVLFGEKSALYKNLVIDEQKLRSLDANMFFTRDPYLFTVNARLVKPEDLEYVKNAIIRTIEQAKVKPIDAQLLSDTKSRQRYSMAMGMDSPSSIAEILSSFIWVSGNPESLNKAFVLYDLLTPEDLMAVAKKYLVRNGVTVATISAVEVSPIKY